MSLPIKYSKILLLEIISEIPGLNVPAGHNMHDADPAADVFPGPHHLQTSNGYPCLAPPAENIPSGHLRQDGLRSSTEFSSRNW